MALAFNFSTWMSILPGSWSFGLILLLQNCLNLEMPLFGGHDVTFERPPCRKNIQKISQTKLFIKDYYWMLICFRKPIQQGDWRVRVWLWWGSGRHPGERRGQRDQGMADASVRDQPPDPPGQWGRHHQVSDDCKIMVSCREDFRHGKYMRWKLLTPSHKTKWPTGSQMIP